MSDVVSELLVMSAEPTVLSWICAPVIWAAAYALVPLTSTAPSSIASGVVRRERRWEQVAVMPGT